MSALVIRMNSVGSDSNRAHGGLEVPEVAPTAVMLRGPRVAQVHLIYWPVWASSADRRSSLRQTNDRIMLCVL